MIQTVVAPVVPGRMNDKEREQFMLEARAALNAIGHTYRSLTTPGDGVGVVIFESPPIPKSSQVEFRIFVNGFLAVTPDFSCTFEKRASYARAAGAAVLVVASSPVSYPPFGQSATVAVTADSTVTITVNDNGSNVTDWNCWVEIRA